MKTFADLRQQLNRDLASYREKYHIPERRFKLAQKIVTALTLNPVMHDQVPNDVMEQLYRDAQQTAELTPAQINKELDRLDKERSELCDLLIAQGRGHERPTDTYRKTDPLSQACLTNYEKRMILRNEIARRWGPNPPSRLPTRR